MIKVKIFIGMTKTTEEGTYFYNVDTIVNKFLEERNVEYIDCKYLYDEDYGDKILLIYKEK